LAAVIPLVLLTGSVPLKGAALIPTVVIILGGTMTVVAARRSLDTLTMRLGEVEAAVSLGLTERDSHIPVIERATADAVQDLVLIVVSVDATTSSGTKPSQPFTEAFNDPHV
jgi:putative ABC transport system permease protein